MHSHVQLTATSETRIRLFYSKQKNEGNSFKRYAKLCILCPVQAEPYLCFPSEKLPRTNPSISYSHLHPLLTVQIPFTACNKLGAIGCYIKPAIIKKKKK